VQPLVAELVVNELVVNELVVNEIVVNDLVVNELVVGQPGDDRTVQGGTSDDRRGGQRGGWRTPSVGGVPPGRRPHLRTARHPSRRVAWALHRDHPERRVRPLLHRLPPGVVFRHEAGTNRL